MTKRPLGDRELLSGVQARGFQPARQDVPALFSRLEGDDPALAEAAERALARLGLPAAHAALARFPPSAPPARGRLCRLIGRVAQAAPARELHAFLLERLEEAEPKTRRNAIIALGKVGGAGVEAALLAAWTRVTLPERRSIAAALGKIGGAGSQALLDQVETEDAELRRIVGEARLKLERTLGRASAGVVDPTRAAEGAARVRLHCREGLESFVVEELGARFRPRVCGAGVVEAELRGPMVELYRSRVMLRFGFPLQVKAGLPIAEAVVDAIGSDEAWRIVRAFTVGAPRYRIEWASGGHRRGLTFRTAAAVAKRRPEWVNDPTESLWEVVVTEGLGALSIELWPRGLQDERFSYRREHLPASSHPTVAAALARVAGVRDDDVVWDPFVGAATELVERARLGGYARLLGSDVDPNALTRARANLDAAGVTGAELVAADARGFVPEGVTLILTNPPLGRRVLNKTLTGALYEQFLANAAKVLRPGGRLVWISPRAQTTVDRAGAVGFRSTFRRRIDMAGFWGEIQAFVRR